jgi:hypothetical protein
MEFFKIKKDIPFMSYGKLTTSISDRKSVV